MIKAYLLLINLITFAVFAVDKRAAINDEWRVPEKVLMSLCLLGGALGGYASMHIFHHKTKHKKFTIGVPTILLIEIIILEYSGLLK